MKSIRSMGFWAQVESIHAKRNMQVKETAKIDRMVQITDVCRFSNGFCKSEEKTGALRERYSTNKILKAKIELQQST